MIREPSTEQLLGPFIDAKGEPPGRFVNGHWQGPTEWHTRHGHAVVRWKLGAPDYVWNAQALDGERVDVQGTQPAGLTFRLEIGNGFTHGTIDIEESDVRFTPLSESPFAEVDGDHQTLQQVLMQDEAFTHDLCGSAFAAALYSVLENREFVGLSEMMRVKFGQRSAARFVAALRGNGEIYLDYAWGRGPAFGTDDAERVRAHLVRLGIRAVPPG